jgi:hypothetical protein
MIVFGRIARKLAVLDFFNALAEIREWARPAPPGRGFREKMKNKETQYG